ncbi:unnamed protein product [Musa acuminata var. zebrina]
MSFTLVSNILASRGIDFAGVDHVLLFDFPRDPIEYVCHVGRTAQGAGGNGTAYDKAGLLGQEDYGKEQERPSMP